VDSAVVAVASVEAASTAGVVADFMAEAEEASTVVAAVDAAS